MNNSPYDLFKKIEFGDPDGLYDKNISEYFIDNNYWGQLVEGRKFFVIGRKGTGKSAIYNWIKSQEAERNVLVSNLSFKDFPFERLLQLSDDDFYKPNQYQSVWRNIILTEIAKLIILDEKASIDDYYRELFSYVELKFGKDLIDLHKKVAKLTVKNEAGLFLKGSGLGTSSADERELCDDYSNVTNINRRLEQLISNYLKCNQTNPYIIQFDQLDDIFTVYINNNDEYFQSIISLFKVIYNINQAFYQTDIPVKVIGYLRSDIFYEINNYDAESARWDAHKLYLNWAIINRSDWRYPPLLQMLDKRVLRSIPDLNLNGQDSAFRAIMKDIKISDRQGNEKNVFTYMIHKSFQRPRDLIQFCKKIQDHSLRVSHLNARCITDSEKEYSVWLLTEVSNEFGPFIKQKPTLYDFLRNLGNRFITYEEACQQYSKYEKPLGMSADKLFDLLYRLGIIFNVNVNSGQTEYFSILRNEQSIFNQKLSICLHPGIMKGLHTYSNQ